MKSRLVLPSVTVGLGLLVGCSAATLHMIPAPVLYKDDRIDLSQRLPPHLRSTQLQTFYATNRAPASSGKSGHYTAGESETVTLGTADVTLGDVDWRWEDLVASDRTDTIEHPRPARVDQVQEFGPLRGGEEMNEAEQTFVSRIDEHLAMTRNQDVVLYVHGYRVTFDEVSVLMASFARYLGHAATVSFQWPTNLHVWSYLTDCPRARKHIPDIERLIELVSHTKAERLNLVAYSCGSPLLADALVRLRARYPAEQSEALRQRFRIGNVIFAASDIDVKTFARESFLPIRELAAQIVVYISKNDSALGFASLVAGRSRVGRPDLSELTREDLAAFAADPRFEVIDVTDVRGAHEMGGMKGHGYWFANEWISSDVTISMRYPIPARQRCLQPGPLKNTWRLPADYPDCLVKRLIETYPDARRLPAPPPDLR